MFKIFHLNRFQIQSTMFSNILTAAVRKPALLVASQNIHFSPCLMAEPLKKKKRIDPAILKAREERKKRRIEKQIRRLEKIAKQLKPIEEAEIPYQLQENISERKRVIPSVLEEILEKRIRIEKKWCSYKKNQILVDSQMLDRIVFSQQRALDELRMESEDLYQAAIQIDEDLVKFSYFGPTTTPKIENYSPPDGEYIDISKKWE